MQEQVEPQRPVTAVGKPAGPVVHQGHVDLAGPELAQPLAPLGLPDQQLQAGVSAKAAAAVGKAASVTSPDGSGAAKSASASSIRPRMRSAWPASRRPASVSSAARAVRSSSVTPASCSSLASCWETADGV